MEMKPVHHDLPDKGTPGGNALPADWAAFSRKYSAALEDSLKEFKVHTPKVRRSYEWITILSL
ncbi:MAG: hypothetical protein HONBIEJF_02588 [Fimbriimonadaceae bacterium]|nr:hypothetical protein [Fimbriimonadaceae bacterium]